jgi:hypothetical protein
MRLHMGEQLLVHALRRPAQRELAQRRQVARREVVLERALRLLGHVYLALFQALDQIVGRDVDKLDGVGAIKNRVRHGLAHAHVRDLRDHIVEALDVLDVDGGVNVDVVTEQLLHVEVALGMAAAGHVGVGELVDQYDLRVAGDDGVEIHLLERLSPVFEPLAGSDLEPLEQGLRFLAPVGFDDADDDIVAVLLPGAGLLQHLVGFADAGSGAHKDLEPAGSAFFPSGGLEQGLRRRSLVRVAPLVRHRDSRSIPCEGNRSYLRGDALDIISRSCHAPRKRGIQ